MLDIYNYIELSKEERQVHLNLNEQCIERGGNSTIHKGVLAVYLNTTIPSGYKVFLCHACNNPKCSNQKHLYFGTPKENIQDSKDAGTWTSIWDRSILKYGYEEACRRNKRGSEHASKAGKGNLGKTKTQKHKDKIAASLKKHNKPE